MLSEDFRFKAPTCLIAPTVGWDKRVSDFEVFMPSIDWAKTGPLIERERITVMADFDGWFADARHRYRKEPHEEGSWCTQGRGKTPLIAAMRAFVVSKLGEEIDLSESEATK